MKKRSWCSKMRKLDNGADVESAQSKISWARIQFNVYRKNGIRRGAADCGNGVRVGEQRESRKTADWVGMWWE